MRLALHPTSETGHRAGRILLGERDLGALGIYGHRSRETEDRRSTAITDLAGFALLGSDDSLAPLDLAVLAAEDGLSCVLAADVTPPADLVNRFAAAGLTLLVAASLPGLAEVLAAHPALGTGPTDAEVVAWTVAGRGATKGEAIPFPDPLGARWGRGLPARPGDPPARRRFEAPVDGPWAGALARVSRAGTDRLVAVADEGPHLAGICLAAGMLAMARGLGHVGACRPADLAVVFLREAVAVGLAVAGFEEGPGA